MKNRIRTLLLTLLTLVITQGAQAQVASIGDNTYSSLAAAVAEASAGDVITMTADDTSLSDGSEIEIDKSLTITGPTDSKGEPMYTIFGNSNQTGTNDIFIKGSGNVTISNLKIKNFGNNAATDTGHAPIYVSTNFTGKVNLSNVYISDFNRGGIFLYGGSFNVDGCYIDCANSKSGAFTKGIEIKGNANGTIQNTVICNMERSSTRFSNAGIEIYGNGSILVDNCTIISDNGNHQSVKGTYGIVSSRVGVHNPSGGSLQVKDCMFDCTNACLSITDDETYGPVNNYSITVDKCDFNNYIATWSATSSITINSGTFCEDVYADEGSIIIKGGEFSNFAPYAGENGSIAISGGVFDKPVPEEYCAEGFIPAQNTNPETQDDYPYSVKAIVPIVSSSSLIVFHDSGEYEQAFDVPMYTRMAGAEIYYKVNDGTPQKYSGPVSISADTELEAWLQIDDTKVGESITRTYTIVTPTTGPSITEGYYTIKNNGNSNNVNVAGRKTVTFLSDEASKTAAGTVIKVKATDGKVEVLRSQGVDLPGYANRAMRYVPDIVQMVVNKLGAEGSGEILGETGYKAIWGKFNESFDPNLYLEYDANYGYRIYGRTPSMKPVVDFYAENKDKVDAKLPQLEAFVNSAINKILEKTGGRGSRILKPFSVRTIWEKMGGTLTEPTDEASTALFYEEVLASEANVWSFFLETAKFYYEPLITSNAFQDLAPNIGEYSQYLEKLPNVHPNFKYYIVANDNNKVDYYSEGNANIINGDASTYWTLTERENFNVEFDENNVKNLGTEYYTTLYTDFGYVLPNGVKAFKVSEIDDEGYATLEEVNSPIAPQTPIMLMTTDKTNLTPALTLNDGGTAVTDNLLVGPDYLINEYEIKTKQLEGLFNTAKDILGDNFYNTYIQEYEHLLMLNAGTAGNKYFFGMTVDGTLSDAYKQKTKQEMEESIVRVLGMGDYKLGYGGNKLGFFSSWDALKANKAFLVHESDPVKLIKMADVTRDGIIDSDDVVATVDIIADLDNTVPYKYDHDAADVKEDFNVIDSDDVMGIVDIIATQGSEQSNP